MFMARLGRKTLVFLPRTLKGSNSNAIIQAELLQVTGKDSIALPHDKDARRRVLLALNLLNAATTRMLIQKVDAIEYRDIKDLVSALNWNDETLQAALESRTLCGVLCAWRAKYSMCYWNSWSQGTTPLTPTVTDELALTAAVKYITTDSDLSIDLGQAYVDAVLLDALDKLDLVQLAKTSPEPRHVFRLMYSSKVKEEDVRKILDAAYDTALRTKNWRSMRDLACLNLHDKNERVCTTETIRHHFSLIQKIVTLPEMIADPEESTTGYGVMISHIHAAYGVGFSLILPDK